MEQKPGYKTTEFWVTAAVNIVGSIVAIFAAKGLVTPDEGQLWVALVQAVAVAVVPLVLAYTNGKYIDSRKETKVAQISNYYGDSITIEDITEAVGLVIGDDSEAGVD